VPAPDSASFDVFILSVGTKADYPDARVGMGFVIGPRHVLTCAHVVAEALGDKNGWVDERKAPKAKIPIAFTLSRKAGRNVEFLSIEAWWPERSRVENWKKLDDVALLALPEGRSWPGDVCAALQGDDLRTGLPVVGSGLGIKTGAPFKGEVVKAVPGNRWALVATGSRDLRVVEGCSGAAVESARGVVGMMAERQGEESGLFIPITDLLSEQSVAMAWRAPSLIRKLLPDPQQQTNSISAEYRAWLGLSLSVRLDRFIPSCDRTDVWEDVRKAIGRPAQRPAIGVLGCTLADLPERFLERVQAELLIETGAIPEQPPPREDPIELSWRPRRRWCADEALARMKVSFYDHLCADDASPEAICKALREGRPQAFYSLVDPLHLDSVDLELFGKWCSYWSDIASLKPAKPPVYLLCVWSEDANQEQLLDAVEALTKASSGDICRNLDLLPCLHQTDLRRWADTCGPRAGLDANRTFQLRNRLLNAPALKGSPRLRALEQWLADLSDEDFR
jgi:hypothetical protein